MTAPALKQQVAVCIGKAGQTVGQLSYVKEGAREYSAFAYDNAWLSDPARFEVSPDLALVSGQQVRRAPSKIDSCFHHALADTEPDAWGRRVIARAHARARKTSPQLKALNAFDYLSAVDDFSRMGALRLQHGSGAFLQTVDEGQRATPPLVDLLRIFEASRAVEGGQETAEDLRYLQGKGTSLGGMRPKCTVLDVDGSLALGKFPSLLDERNVTRAEVLALHLAQRAGIDAASARVLQVGNTPVAVIRRFDRTPEHARIHYLSAASMLQAKRHEERSYTEIADVIRAKCANPTADVQQLWRRLVFNLLITNVDDHLQNLGFLYVGQGQWRLAPHFDLNPFPDKDRESKTWLSEATGPITSLDMLMAQASYFSLPPTEALQVLAQVYASVLEWRAAALGPDVGLLARELDDFAPAFEHDQMDEARWVMG
ncbi:MAG: type II toxin-antitoxin system HipA family toxin [Comamonadaceae bacterium CG_4_9_14_0_8_um_filter_57_21]|nr:MAG: type II toxin-antitoxin system HipA family toxin [Comamonadaceae bacterium CG_4_9_14_0_8_um_filter_57_21]